MKTKTMKISKDTLINMVMYKESNSDTLITSANLNMTFGEYSRYSLISKMLNYEYTKGSVSYTTSTTGYKAKLTNYHYQDSKVTCGFTHLEFI